jgi:hypothetical protein
MSKFSNALGPVSRPLEKILKRPLVFSLLVLYQGLFSGNAVKIPNRLKNMFENPAFRFGSLFMIALAASQDIEYALMSTIIFIFVLYALKTPEEREKTGLI